MFMEAQALPVFFFNGDLVPELVNAIVEVCPNRALNLLARLNKTWYDKTRALRNARLRDGLTVSVKSNDPAFINVLAYWPSGVRYAIPENVRIYGQHCLLEMNCTYKSYLSVMKEEEARNYRKTIDVMGIGLRLYPLPRRDESTLVASVSHHDSQGCVEIRHILRGLTTVGFHETPFYDTCILALGNENYVESACHFVPRLDLMLGARFMRNNAEFYRQRYGAMKRPLHPWNRVGLDSAALRAFQTETYQGFVLMTPDSLVLIDDPDAFYNEARRLIYLAQQVWDGIYEQIRTYCNDHDIILVGDLNKESFTVPWVWQ